MRLIQDRHIERGDNKVVATGDKYKDPTETLLKEVSAEYARVVQKYPAFKFAILLDTEKGELTLSWEKL